MLTRGLDSSICSVNCEMGHKCGINEAQTQFYEAEAYNFVQFFLFHLPELSNDF